MLYQQENNWRDAEQVRLAPLLRGILEDGRTLLHQEVALLSAEARQEVYRIKKPAAYVLLGTGFSFIGAILFFITAVYALSSGFPDLAMWECFAIVAVFAEAVGLLFLYLTRRRLRRS